MAMARTAEVYADFLLPYLASDTHLVDVGCGSGELSLDLARRVGAVTGIDMDPDEVSAAGGGRLRSHEHRLPGG